MTLEESISLLEVLGQIPRYSPREAYRKPAPSPLAKLGIKTGLKDMSGLAWSHTEGMTLETWIHELKKIWGKEITWVPTRIKTPTRSDTTQVEATIGQGKEKQTVGWWTKDSQSVAKWRGAADSGSDDASEF